MSRPIRRVQLVVVLGLALLCKFAGCAILYEPPIAAEVISEQLDGGLTNTRQAPSTFERENFKKFLIREPANNQFKGLPGDQGKDSRWYQIIEDLNLNDAIPAPKRNERSRSGASQSSSEGRLLIEPNLLPDQRRTSTSYQVWQTSPEFGKNSNRQELSYILQKAMPKYLNLRKVAVQNGPTQTKGSQLKNRHAAGSEEFVVRTPIIDPSNNDFEWKRVENTRWNSLRGMWGKRSDPDLAMQHQLAIPEGDVNIKSTSDTIN